MSGRTAPMPLRRACPSLDGAGCFEPGSADRELLRYSGAEPVELAPGDGVLVPVEREVQSSADGSLTEAVFPVDCGVEAVPGLWTTGAVGGVRSPRFKRSTTRSSLATWSLRSGQVWWRPRPATAARTSFLSVGEGGLCETCGVSKVPEFSDGCFSCGSVDRAAVRSYQGSARAPGCADGGVLLLASAFSAFWLL